MLKGKPEHEPEHESQLSLFRADDRGQVTEQLQASIFSSEKWGNLPCGVVWL